MNIFIRIIKFKSLSLIDKRFRFIILDNFYF